MDTKSHTNNKDSVLFVRVSEQDKESLATIAEQRDVSVSQFVREAIREKVSAIQEARSEKAEPVVAPV